MGMSVDVSQLNRLAADLTGATVRATLAASTVVRKTALDLEAQAKAFAPVDTGNLRSSIGSDITAMEASVGPTADYGAYVEFGTSRMAPRAFLGPALDRVTPGFVDAMGRISDGLL